MNYKEGSEKVFGKHWDGLLYETGKKDKIIIVFTGSNGLEYAGKSAKYLVDHDIPALALGYFKTKHTPKYLDRIPIECIKDAFLFLKKAGYKKVGIEGISKGAELALAAAIQYHPFFTVIIKAPSYFYSEGIAAKKPSGHSSWTYEGKELPYTPYKDRKIHMMKMLWKAKEYNLLPIHADRDVKKESIISVEKIKAPILMFSTSVDTIWPSKESCLKMVQRLEDHNFKYAYKHISYDHMSHMMIEYCGDEIQHFIKSEKEDPDACFAEREDMGKTTVAWIRTLFNEIL